MANKLFPLISETASATLTLEIDAASTAKTVDFEVDSRTVLINAQGADSAPTYTVNLRGPEGLVFFVDITSLNSNSGSAAAAAVIFSRGANTLTLDAANEAASVLLTKDGLQSASDLDLIGTNANSPTFA